MSHFCRVLRDSIHHTLVRRSVGPSVYFCWMCHFMCSRSVFVSQECLNMSVSLFVSLSECLTFSRSADARDVGLVILFSLKSFNWLYWNRFNHFVSVNCCSFAISYTSNAPPLVISCLRVAKGKLLGSGYNGDIEIICRRHVESFSLGFVLKQMCYERLTFFGEILRRVRWSRVRWISGDLHSFYWVRTKFIRTSRLKFCQKLKTF